jgi:predicted nucleic acid-binding protein
MSRRFLDWPRQAEADLELARHAMQGGRHEWACFAAQQSAERAVKAVHLRLDVPMPEVVALARATGLTACDAAYLWLARALGAERVTLDGDLARAAAGE